MTLPRNRKPAAASRLKGGRNKFLLPFIGGIYTVPRTPTRISSLIISRLAVIARILRKIENSLSLFGKKGFAKGSMEGKTIQPRDDFYPGDPPSSA